MRNKTKVILFAIVILCLLSIAADCVPTAHCSQGFWKNKGYKIFHESPYWPADSYPDLFVRGPGSEAIRDAATRDFNQSFWMADEYCMD
jgi:hypothetical protein